MCVAGGENEMAASGGGININETSDISIIISRQYQYNSQYQWPMTL